MIARFTLPAVKGGMATRIRTEVHSIVQIKNGTLNSVMPGVRIPRMVAMKLTPPAMVPAPETISPSAHK